MTIQQMCESNLIGQIPILIVEDENNLGKTLQEHLISQGLKKTKWAKSISEAERFFKSFLPQVIVMDIGLPDGSGIELAKKLKEKDHGLSILFLSALSDPNIRVTGLELGADDYITKPFALKELTLRLEKILKLQKLPLSEELCFGPLKIWFNRFEVQDAYGNQLSLSHKECYILRYLFRNKDQVVSRDDIINEVWGEDQFPSNRTVDNYIVKLRKWMETDSSHSLEIQSMRSVGYKLLIKGI